MEWISALWLSFQAPAVIPPVIADCGRHCQVSVAGIDLIRRFEGFSPVPYRDAAGKLTIGVGHLIRPGEDFTRPLFPDQADALLKKDLGVAEGGIRRRVMIGLKQQQFDALASFTFNLGEGALAKSTLLKKVNARQHQQVPAQFIKWVYAGGVKLAGLVRRRQEEGELYVS